MTAKVKGTKRYEFTMKEKEIIVAEAYHISGNVKATAKKYSILPTNIHQWKKRIPLVKSSVNSNSWETIKLKKQYGASGKLLHKNIFPQLAIFLRTSKQPTVLSL